MEEKLRRLSRCFTVCFFSSLSSSAPSPSSLAFLLPLKFPSHDGKGTLLFQVRGQRARTRRARERAEKRTKPKRNLTSLFKKSKNKKRARVVVRLRPLSSSEEAKAAAGAASSRCAQPTPCGKALVLSGVGSSASSTTTNSASAPPPPPTPATAAFDNSADNSASSSSFSFPDGVLGEGATQRQVYETVAEVVEGVLQGKSASIVAYGKEKKKKKLFRVFFDG